MLVENDIINAFEGKLQSLFKVFDFDDYLLLPDRRNISVDDLTSESFRDNPMCVCVFVEGVKSESVENRTS